MSDTTNQSTTPPPSHVASVESSKPAPPAASQQSRPVDSSVEAHWATLWLTDRDVVVFTVLAAIVLVTLVFRWGQLSGWGREEIEIERMTPLPLSMHLDPNEASWVELSQLEGVGEALALRIVEDRESKGPFRNLDDLDRVKGIGPKTIERLRPYLKINRPAESR